MSCVKMGLMLIYLIPTKGEIMEELKRLRAELMEKWNFFSKLGGEWNDGYFHAISDAVEIIDKEIRSLEKPLRQLNESVHDHNPYIEKQEMPNIDWKIINKKSFWKIDEK